MTLCQQLKGRRKNLKTFMDLRQWLMNRLKNLINPIKILIQFYWARLPGPKRAIRPQIGGGSLSIECMVHSSCGLTA